MFDEPDEVKAFRNFSWRRDEVEALEVDVQTASAAVAVAQSAVDALVIEARTEMPKVTADAVYGEEVSSHRLAEGALGHGDAAVVMPGPAEATDAELIDEQGAAREAVSNGSCECGGGSFVFRIPLFFSLAFFSLFVVMLGSFKPIVRASSSVVAGSQSPLEASTVSRGQLGSVGVGRGSLGFDDVGLDVGAGLGVVVNGEARLGVAGVDLVAAVGEVECEGFVTSVHGQVDSVD